jgi:hypothetical protein
VNVVAGYAQMCGATPWFPEPDDARAIKEAVSVYVVIRGANYGFHVAKSMDHDNGWHFTVPIAALAPSTIVIGVARETDLSSIFLELDREGLEKTGKRRGVDIEVTVTRDDGCFRTGDHEWLRISTFAERL